MKAMDFIATVPLFSAMTPLELKAVMETLEPRIYPANTTVYRAGDAGFEMYVVHSGSIATREGRTFGPKDFLGEMALVSGKPRGETARAEKDTKVFVLSGLNFQRMVWDTPMLGVKFLRAMDRIKIERLAEASGFLDGMVRWGETARRRAVTDDLSGLFNRRFLEEAIAGRLPRGFGDGKKCALAMIDLDRFREVNLRYGAVAGDAVIANVGATIQRVAGSEAIAARLSGDEFALFLPEGDAARAAAIATRVQEETAALWLEFKPAPGAAPERLRITMSAGVAVCPDQATTREGLITAADRGLYRAKEGGRNRVCLA